MREANKRKNKFKLPGEIVRIETDFPGGCQGSCFY